MLRITISMTSAGQTAIVLEGRLVGAWVAELERSILAEAARAPAAHLELGGLTFADGEGVALLRDLRGHGFELRGATSFMLALMGGDDGGTRTIG